LGTIDLMLLAILIYINIRLSLFNFSRALWKDFSLALLVSVLKVPNQDPKHLGEFGLVHTN